MSFIKLIIKIAKIIASLLGIIPNEKQEEMNKQARNCEKQWEDYHKAANKKEILGLEKMNIGNYEAAIKEFDEGIKIYPLKNSIIWHRAHAKEMLGDYEAALKDYEYVENKPIFPIRQSGEYDKSSGWPWDLYVGDKIYESYCSQHYLLKSQIYPDNSNNWRWNLAVGRTKFEMGDYKGAIDRFELCLPKKDMFGFNVTTIDEMGKNDEHLYYYNEAKKALKKNSKSERIKPLRDVTLNTYPFKGKGRLNLIEKSFIESNNINIENIAKGILRNSETREL
jgi:tetratricopeptide (TPR) repeat protein